MPRLDDTAVAEGLQHLPSQELDLLPAQPA
jgi:hypothetical protein